MTKKQTLALLICGLLLFLIGGIFSVHDVAETYTISWSTDDDISFRFSGFELYFLNKSLASFESSYQWYALLDLVLGILRPAGLILIVTAIVLILWDRFYKRKEDKKEETALERSNNDET